jgi:hypothetical protein
MADNKDLKAKRVEAYEYIKYTLNRPPWHIPLDISDAELANKLGGTLELERSLRLLREGKHNPTKRLLSAFKNFVGELEAKSVIKSKLCDPFK